MQRIGNPAVARTHHQAWLACCAVICCACFSIFATAAHAAPKSKSSSKARLNWSHTPRSVYKKKPPVHQLSKTSKAHTSKTSKAHTSKTSKAHTSKTHTSKTYTGKTYTGKTQPKKKSYPKPAKVAQVPAPAKPQTVLFSISPAGEVFVPSLPRFDARFAGRVVGIGTNREVIFYSMSPALQSYAAEIVRQTRAPHVAVVAMEPQTGRILALAQKSTSIENPALHSGFPAASLFKVVTSAAALEKGTVGPFSKIYFRGGNYTLDKTNYQPDTNLDRRSMQLGEALGKSCNPVFGRVALEHLNAPTLSRYAKLFGFNTDLRFNTTLMPSTARIPSDDYEISRTGAGFGDVTISAVHAAAMMSAVANDGMLPKPTFIDHILSPGGMLLYRAKTAYRQRVVRPATAQTLLRMMQYTTTIGTSKTEFMKGSRPVMPDIAVAAKTGTLRGNNPRGLNRWFIAAAPVSNPQITVAVIVVNPATTSARPSHIGRLLIERYLRSGMRTADSADLSRTLVMARN